jgi:CRP-like cAMP-binding protein
MFTVDDGEGMPGSSAGNDGGSVFAASSGNLLLASLPDADRALLEAEFERVPLEVGQVLCEADAAITHVYFPHAGLASVVSAMTEGTVEVGTAGRDGFVGVPVLLHAVSSPTRTFVQVAGSADRIAVDRLMTVVGRSQALRRALYRFVQAFLEQVAQTAACNRLHTLEERCARWLLLTQDRIGTDHIPLTQQFLSFMLGVHRPAVTLAAGALQRAGLIRYSRGRITVLDRAGLESAACACYEISRRSVERLANDLQGPTLEG